MADNDLDRLIGALVTPKEVERVLAQLAKQALLDCRVSNKKKHEARPYIETALHLVVTERGYVRFGVYKTIGNLVAKMMVGYEQGYNLVQPKLEKAKKRFESRHYALKRFDYWTREKEEEFLRAYWSTQR